MGRNPSNGVPAFRFTPMEVAQMEAIFREHNNQLPAKEMSEGLADQFSKSAERAGKITVQAKQVWNWFQNKRYALRAKMVKGPMKLTVSSMPRDEVASIRIALQGPMTVPVTSGGKSAPENSQSEFEAKSSRDGAWYDVQGFLSHRYLETGDPEVLVRFVGFGTNEVEWINIRRHVRPRSLPCESTECVVVLPGDLILCFQEGKEQALYFDAHVVDAQRRRHDVRGCRCRFLVRYDHDLTEEIVPLKKLCRRPETDYRFNALHAANDTTSYDSQKAYADPTPSISLTVPNPQIATPAYQRAPMVLQVGSSAAPASTHPRAAAAAKPVTLALAQAAARATLGTRANMISRPMNAVATQESTPGLQSNLNATLGAAAPARGNDATNGNVISGSMVSEQMMVEPVVPVQAGEAATTMTATATATSSGQKQRDVSPPPGFIKLSSANPMDSTVAAPSNPMEE